MIFVKTVVRKIFDEVPSEQDIKNKFKEAFSNAEYNEMLDTFFMQGKMKKHTHKWEQDDFDNWIYTSMVAYPDFESYQECFEHPAGQAIQRKVVEAGFEINVSVKEISHILEKEI